MSDFSSDFWEFYIGVITVVSILACALLLPMNTMSSDMARPRPNWTPPDGTREAAIDAECVQDPLRLLKMCTVSACAKGACRMTVKIAPNDKGNPPG